MIDSNDRLSFGVFRFVAMARVLVVQSPRLAGKPGCFGFVFFFGCEAFFFLAAARIAVAEAG